MRGPRTASELHHGRGGCRAHHHPPCAWRPDVLLLRWLVSSGCLARGHRERQTRVPHNGLCPSL